MLIYQIISLFLVSFKKQKLGFCQDTQCLSANSLLILACMYVEFFPVILLLYNYLSFNKV